MFADHGAPGRTLSRVTDSESDWTTTLPKDAGQRLVIERARTALPDDERILAVYLIGSYGTGEADEFSDVDVHCVATDESATWTQWTSSPPTATCAGSLSGAGRLWRSRQASAGRGSSLTRPSLIFTGTSASTSSDQPRS
jgi:hypothetical protein